MLQHHRYLVATGFARVVPRGEHDDGRTVFAAFFLTGRMLVVPQVAI
jgi:hypothetical protein